MKGIGFCLVDRSGISADGIITSNNWEQVLTLGISFSSNDDISLLSVLIQETHFVHVEIDWARKIQTARMSGMFTQHAKCCIPFVCLLVVWQFQRDKYTSSLYGSKSSCLKFTSLFLDITIFCISIFKNIHVCWGWCNYLRISVGSSLI